MSTAAGSTGQLDIGGVFEAAADLWKKTFRTVLIMALIVTIPPGIIWGLVNISGPLNGNVTASAIGSLMQLVAYCWLAGMVVRIVQDAEGYGRVDASVGGLFGSVSHKIIPLILLVVVMGITIGIGFIFLFIPGVFLALMWIVSIPSMVVEERGVFDSMSRSASLTRDNRMRILAVGIVLAIAYSVIGFVAGFLATISPILGVLGGFATAVIIYSSSSLVVTVLYFRLREIKGEGVVADVGVEPPAPAV